MNSHIQALSTWPLGNLIESITEVTRRIEPLVSESDFQEFKKLASNFLGSKESSLLQSLLAKHAKEKGNHWFQEFWDEMYLSWRAPLPIDMNFVLELDMSSYPRENNLSRLSRVIHSIAQFIDKIANNRLAKESLRGKDLCMDPFTRMFSTRLAKANKDEMFLSKLNEPLRIIFIHKGEMTELNLQTESGSITSLVSIERSLKKIIQKVNYSFDISPITTLLRKQSAELWSDILKNKEHAENLEKIKNACFVVCLDEEKEMSSEEFQKSLLAGKAFNRFFDKSLQVIQNGEKIGFNIEHTPCDAGPWLSLCEEIKNSLPKDDTLAESCELNTKSLKWDLSPAVKKKIESSRINYANKADQLHYHSIKLDHLGKESIKALKISPDAFFQLSFQVALLKTFGTRYSTYESVSMRNYQFGRTECTRPGTKEAFQLAEAIISNETNIKLLIHKAANAHIERITDCQKGKCAEKHLFALQKILNLNSTSRSFPNIHKLLNSPALQKLKSDKLSTSNSSSEAIKAFGFGPVHSSGIGIGYTIKKESTHLSISYYNSITESGNNFIRYLNKSLTNLKKILSN